VKAALAAMGLVEPIYRLPLVPPRPASLAKIRRVLASLELLPAGPAAGREADPS
jgi:hypothetical protein